MSKQNLTECTQPQNTRLPRSIFIRDHLTMIPLATVLTERVKNVSHKDLTRTTCSKTTKSDKPQKSDYNMIIQNRNLNVNTNLTNLKKMQVLMSRNRNNIN